MFTWIHTLALLYFLSCVYIELVIPHGDSTCSL
jgi:hypothetical protein